MPDFLGNETEGASVNITNLSASGNDLTTLADLTITGDLTVSGDTVTTNTTTITIEDPIVDIATTNVGNTVNFGIQGTYNDGVQKYAALLHSKDNDEWYLSEGTSASTTSTTLAATGSLRADTITATTGVFSSTVTVPTYTGAARPASAAAGTIIYNSTTDTIQVFTTSWRDITTTLAPSHNFVPSLPLSTTTDYSDRNVAEVTGGPDDVIFSVSADGCYHQYGNFTNLFNYHVGPEANALGWISDNYTTGAYSGPESTSYDATSIAGDWIQVEFEGGARPLYGYRMLGGNVGTADLPTDWIMLGSNDGSTWVSMHTIISGASMVAVTSYSNPEYTEVVCTNTTEYSHYRLVVSDTGGNQYMKLMYIDWLKYSDSVGVVSG